jgi:hypothetical protein
MDRLGDGRRRPVGFNALDFPSEFTHAYEKEPIAAADVKQAARRLRADPHEQPRADLSKG